MSSVGGSANSLADSSVLEGSMPRSARKRAPTARYVEEDSYQLVKKVYSEMSPTGKKRGRKSAQERSTIAANNGKDVNSKWSVYKRKISQLARTVARDQHFIDSYEYDESDFAGKRAKHTPEHELRKCYARIVYAKKAIIEQFAALTVGNASHKQWMQLKKGFDAEDTFDVDDIMCSVCGGPDEEGNDVLFCDRANCLRAYHQMCLDPPVLTLDGINDDDDWFCRQCACMDECLDLVGEVLGHDCDDYTELFPELKPQSSGGAANSIVVDDDSESEDADYDPSELETDEVPEVSEDDEHGGNVGDDVQSGDESVKKAKHRKQKERDEVDASGGSGTDESGAESEEEDEDSDTSDDSADDGASDATSGVDEEELQGLLRDAQADGVNLGPGLLPGLPDDAAGDAAPRRNLRPRRTGGSGDPMDRSRTPEGAADVGKAVAMVRRGVLISGEIVAFRYKTTHISSPGRVKKGKHSVGPTVAPYSVPICAPISSAASSSEPVTSTKTSTPMQPVSSGGDGDYFMDTGVDEDSAAPMLSPVDAQISTSSCGSNSNAAAQAQISISAQDTAQVSAQSSVQDSGDGGAITPPAPPALPSLEDGVWTAKFEDDSVILFNLETLRAYFELFAEYAAKRARELQEQADHSSSSSSHNKMLSVLEEQGKLDSANVLTHKRARKPLDYALLSLQMFGDVPDEEDSSGDEAQFNDERAPDAALCGKKRGRPRKIHSDSPQRASHAERDPGSAADGTPNRAGKKRGRPRTVPAARSSDDAGGADEGYCSDVSGEPQSMEGISEAGSSLAAGASGAGVARVASSESGKKRGRPRKASAGVDSPAQGHDTLHTAGATSVMKQGKGRGRGRPKGSKNRVVAAPAAVSDAGSDELPRSAVQGGIAEGDPVLLEVARVVDTVIAVIEIEGGL